MPALDMLVTLASVLLKCSLLLGAALVVGRIASRSNPAAANLIYRQSLLLALLIPIFEFSKSYWLASSNAASAITNLVALPTVRLDLGGIVTGTDSLSWIEYSPAVILIFVIAGAFVLLLKTILGGVYVRRVLRSAERAELSNAISSDNSSQSTIQLWYSADAPVPFTCGFFRQRIVLPSALRSQNARTIRMIIQHELIHVERRDNLWGFISSLAVALNWYNPLAWIVHRAMIFEAERCCDAASIQGSPFEYASLLLELARSAKMHRVNAAFGSMIIGKKQMEARIMSILQSTVRKQSLTASFRRLVIAATLIALLPMAALQVALTEQLQPLPEKQNNKQEQPKSEDAQYPEPNEFVRVDSMPAVLHAENPVYPDEAKKKGVEGSVWIKALVDKSGTVVKALVDKTSGVKSLDDAAQVAALKFTYKPALAKGKKVSVWVTYEVKFALKSDQKKP